MAKYSRCNLIKTIIFGRNYLNKDSLQLLEYCRRSCQPVLDYDSNWIRSVSNYLSIYLPFLHLFSYHSKSLYLDYKSIACEITVQSVRIATLSHSQVYQQNIHLELDCKQLHIEFSY